MSTDSFTEAMHRLREIHDKDVLGMQAKLSELTVEKCRDAQRIEELFSKNHVLREQHKVLNENIKVLENRLRAGLCDRCTVTQELAKKKQQEFENAHFHSLQQISSLTKEINSLKEENRLLVEELKTLQCLENKLPKNLSPENNLGSDSPLAHGTHGNQKNSQETLNKDGDTQQNLSDRQTPEEKCSVNPRLSPGQKTFQAVNADVCLREMNMSGAQKSLQNQQRISNQLHGTIAVLRSKSGHTGPAPSPAHNKRNSANEPHAKGSSDDFYDASVSQHSAQRHPVERGPGSSVNGAVHHLLAKSREALLERKRSQDNWDERAAMVELHDALLYMREHGYRGRMTQPSNRDRLHYILSRQHQVQRSPQSPEDVQKLPRKENLESEGELSLLQVLRAQWKNNKRQDNQTEEQEWVEKESKHGEVEQTGHEEEMTPDKPLDLSDTKRGQHSQHCDNKREQRGMFETYLPSPTFSNCSSPPTRTSSIDLVHTGVQEDSRSAAWMEQNTEKSCSQQEEFQESMTDPKSCTEKDMNLLATKRSARGQKLDCRTEPGLHLVLLFRIGVLKSYHSQTVFGSDRRILMETESSQTVQSEPSKDTFVKDKFQGKTKWTKKTLQNSKKSVKRRKKMQDYEIDSDTSQDDGGHDKTNIFS
ncbi:RBBP8 N-terminal-like protein [Pelodytes ibericus]